MKITDVKTFVVGNPPPHFGGRYWICLKLITAAATRFGLERRLLFDHAPLVFALVQLLGKLEHPGGQQVMRLVVGRQRHTIAQALEQVAARASVHHGLLKKVKV